MLHAVGNELRRHVVREIFLDTAPNACCHCSVSAALTLPDLSSQPGPTTADRPSRFAPLIFLVRRIIDYGKQLAASLQHPTPTTNLDQVARTFGSYDFGQILASIMRGLHRARELQDRLVRLDAEPPPEPQPEPAYADVVVTPIGPRPAINRMRMATPEQVARRHATALDPSGNNKPIGEVLADICRDLGILPDHPLWRELFHAILQHGGRLGSLVRDIGNVPLLDPITHQPITAGVPLFGRTSTVASTGPPI